MATNFLADFGNLFITFQLERQKRETAAPGAILADEPGAADTEPQAARLVDDTPAVADLQKSGGGNGN